MISQSFTKDQIEALARMIEMDLRGGDSRVVLKTQAGRDVARKIFAMREASRSGKPISSIDSKAS